MRCVLHDGDAVRCGEAACTTVVLYWEGRRFDGHRQTGSREMNAGARLCKEPHPDSHHLFIKTKDMEKEITLH